MCIVQRIMWTCIEVLWKHLECLNLFFASKGELEEMRTVTPKQQSARSPDPMSPIGSVSREPTLTTLNHGDRKQSALINPSFQPKAGVRS